MHRRSFGFVKVTVAGREAFTLIEMMTVMAIILVLAGMVIGISRYATAKSDIAHTQATIEKVKNALEEYRLDRGSYPRQVTVPTAYKTYMNDIGKSLSAAEAGTLRNSLFMDQCQDDRFLADSIINYIETNVLKQTLAYGTGTMVTGAEYHVADAWNNVIAYVCTNPYSYMLWSCGPNVVTEEGGGWRVLYQDDIPPLFGQ